MPPDWDDDSTHLFENLKRTLRSIQEQASGRNTPSVEAAKSWQQEIMRGLDVPRPEYIGRFRGESGLDHCTVEIGEHFGVAPENVANELLEFEEHFRGAIAFLDESIPSDNLPDASTLDDVLDLCGWVHAEWVRIHPFANGNGRTARLWANYVAMRYGLPPFVQPRPRPENDAYAQAAYQAMTGNWEPTAELFRAMLSDFVDATK